MKAAHSTFARGRRVIVRLKDGTKFIDRFVDNTSVHIVFEGQRIARQAIKSISIYRPPLYTWVLPPRGYYSVNSVQVIEFPNQCPLVSHCENVLCGQPLSANWECPEHGKVRLRPHETLAEVPPPPLPKFRKAKKHVTFRKQT
jgi:hypothetical protein